MRKDPRRLAELRRQLILDTSAEKAYDDIARLMSQSLDVPIALINLMDADRNWSKSSIGVALGESPVETSFCESFFSSDKDIIVVPDTLQHEAFSRHPNVTGEPHVRFYASARVVVNGQTVGSLCAFDIRPRQLLPEQIEHLKTLTLAVIDLLKSRTAPGVQTSNAI
jgi:GAF domain-containing protein